MTQWNKKKSTWLVPLSNYWTQFHQILPIEFGPFFWIVFYPFIGNTSKSPKESIKLHPYLRIIFNSPTKCIGFYQEKISFQNRIKAKTNYRLPPKNRIENYPYWHAIISTAKTLLQIFQSTFNNSGIETYMRSTSLKVSQRQCPFKEAVLLLDDNSSLKIGNRVVQKSL